MRHAVVFASVFMGILLFFVLGSASVQAATKADSSLWPTPATSPALSYNMVPAGPLAWVGQHCGTLGGLRHVGNAPAQEGCLHAAYLRCQAATLLYIQAGVDAGAYHYLTVQPDGARCAVTDRVATYGVGPRHLATYACLGMRFVPTTGTQGGLVAQQCGAEGDIRIPFAAK